MSTFNCLLQACAIQKNVSFVLFRLKYRALTWHGTSYAIIRTYPTSFGMFFLISCALGRFSPSQIILQSFTQTDTLTGGGDLVSVINTPSDSRRDIILLYFWKYATLVLVGTERDCFAFPPHTSPFLPVTQVSVLVSVYSE